MSQVLPPLLTEAVALSVAGSGLRRYEMGQTLIGAGVDATVVIVAPGDDPEVSGVRDSTKVLLRGDGVPGLHSRFDFECPLPIHVFTRLDQGFLPLGTARCRSRSSNHAGLELDKPLTRVMLDGVRPGAGSRLDRPRGSGCGASSGGVRPRLVSRRGDRSG